MMKKRLLCLLTVSLLCFAACRQPAAVNDTLVRPPAVAGVFYPDDPAELARTVDGLLQAAPATSAEGRLLALVVPHAGYAYSAAVAAAGWKALAGMNPDVVYVLGTSHYAERPGIFAWAGDAFRTPLGDYPADAAAVRELAAQCPAVEIRPEAWVREHSVEAQVPFLQRVAPQARLVPLVLAAAPEADCRSLGEAIARQAAGRRAVLVASTDLSHYPAWEDARRVDAGMLKAMLTLDPDAVAKQDRYWMARGIGQLDCTVCGLSAVEAVLAGAGALGADRAKLLSALNSGDVSGDKTRVVGYAAAAFYGPAGPSAPAGGEEWTLEQQTALLALARSSIARILGAAPASSTSRPEWMSVKRPVFVTLREQGELRGCIGMTEPHLPLGEAVARMAQAAACEDPRFPPVTAGELPRLSIEISVLSPLRRIKNPGEIRLGTDGVVVRAQGRSGLFLPQVAAETGWGRERFLDELCSQKAGLPARAWSDPATELHVFTVQAFSEKE